MYFNILWHQSSKKFTYLILLLLLYVVEIMFLYNKYNYIFILGIHEYLNVLLISEVVSIELKRQISAQCIWIIIKKKFNNEGVNYKYYYIIYII